MTAAAWVCVVAAMLEIIGDGQFIQIDAPANRDEIAWQIRRQGGLVRDGSIQRSTSSGGPYADMLLDHRLTPDRASLETYLTAVRDSRARHGGDMDPATLVKQLGAPSFQERERAMQLLTGLTPLPLEALQRAADSGDPEIGERAASIIAAARTRSGKDPTPFPFLLEAICRTIQMKSVEGLAPVLLECLPAVSRPTTVQAVYDALAATATTNDVENLARALQAPSDAVRCAAVYGLKRRHTAPATEALRRALHDKQEHVRLVAAQALLNRAEREGLPPLAEALESEQAAIRHDAVDTLRAVTKQSFGYVAGQPAPQRREATAAWQAWIDDNWKRTAVEFPTDLVLYRYERFKKSISALSEVRSGNVRTRIQVEGEDVVGGTSDFDPGRGIVVLAYLRGRRILCETFPTHVRGAAHSRRLVKTLEELPAESMVALVANGEATQGVSEDTMRGLYAIGGQTKIHGFHAHGTYICIGYRGMLPGRATELVDASGGPLIFRGKPRGVLFRREKSNDL